METSQLQYELSALWQQLASNPPNRALVIARLLVNHADSQTKHLFAQRIAQQTFPSSERDQALALLKSSPINFAKFELPPELPAIRVDPELGRLCIAVSMASPFRIWVIGRELTRTATGSGQVQRKELRESLSRFGVRMTPEHFNRLLRAGEKMFWNVSGNRVFIRSPHFVAHKIVKLAAQKDPDLVATNRPGVRDVYLSPAGSLEAWEAIIYAGWMAHRENPTIARETLEKLFSRSADTLRRWEQKRLQDTLTVRENYAQCHVPENDWFDFIPDHCQSYVANVRYGNKFAQVVRVFWRMPNTYLVRGIRQHPKRGQAAQVRKTVNLELDQPTTLRRGGLHRFKLYFGTSEGLRRHVKKHGGTKYIWRGESRYKKGIFEPNQNGFPVTHARERASYKQEHIYLTKLRKTRQEVAIA